METAAYPSALPLHILPTIPGSACATPVQGATPPDEESEQPIAGPSTPSSVYYNATGPSSAVPSRRSSVSAYTMPGSYFPKVGGLTPSPARSPSGGSPSPSGRSTPGDRPKPSPLNIPDESEGHPLFSNYPDTPNTSGLPTVTPTSHKGKAKAIPPPPFTITPFSLGDPPPERNRAPLRSTVGQLGSPHIWKPLPVPPNESPHKSSRKRAFTVVDRPLPQAPSDSEDDYITAADSSHPASGESSAWESTDRPPLPVKSPVRKQRPRRASLGAFTFPSRRTEEGPEALSFVDDSLGPSADSHQPTHLPFSYLQPADSDYTLQSVSTITQVRPLSSPSVQPPPRRSSLTGGDSAALGLTNLSILEDSVLGEAEVTDSPRDISQPFAPPQRRSSLDYGRSVGKVDQHVTHGDVVFVPGADSASLSTTDTSQSAYAQSPSSSNRDAHPLSSATTSLSRSAKSGNEGDEHNSEGERAVQGALKLQRSLEIEAAKERRRRRLSKRRMIVIELVETEVAYTEDLKALVHIYLPQLAALPFIDAKMAATVSRNTSDLLFFHVQFAARMIDVLREEALPYSSPDEGSSAEYEKVERVVRRLSALFVEDATGFNAYNTFCAGSLAAMDLLRQVSNRPEWQAFEKRCQIISLSTTPVSLAALLADQDSQSSSAPVKHHISMALAQRARLQFRDLLIMPVQRVCRYPMLLASLLGTASTPTAETAPEPFGDTKWDVGVDVERALGAMRSVAEDADEAQKKKVMEARSALIVQRLEWHALLTPTFLSSLGFCVLAGALDVLHHHPVVAPLVPPVKVKYMAAFLYRGYLILAKVKKGKTYEAKHFLPLEVFELIDITEGFLPHSLRLTLREHNFDLAASCEAEKAVWAAALCEARDESTVPPFELPASVSPFAARSRRFSSMGGPSAAVTSTVNHRHSMAGQITVLSTDNSPDASEEKVPLTPAPSSPSSPISPMFSKSTFFPPVTPERRNASVRTAPTILLRRASVGNRMALDRGMADIFSEACSSARSKAQLHQALFNPEGLHSPHHHRLSMRDASVLRRRRSFVDNHGTIDVVAAGPIKGQVMTMGRAKSGPGWKRRSWDGQDTLKRRGSIGSQEAYSTFRGTPTVPSGDTTDGEATASDFGTLLGHRQSGVSRNPSLTSSAGGDTTVPRGQSSSSDSPPPHIRRNLSHTNVRPLSSYMPSMTRRKSASSNGHIYMRPKSTLRSNSVPVSPRLSPTEGVGEPEDSPSYSTLDLDRNRQLPATNRAAREEAVIFNRGAGFTNVAEPVPPVSLLKRSLSFASRGRSKSGQSLMEAWASSGEPLPNQTTSSSVLSSPSPPSTVVSPGEPSPTSPTTELDAESDQPRGLRRKRSLRLFPQLNRFTPMGSSKA